MARSAADRWSRSGAVLAGGAGRRIGGDKAVVELDNRPLLLYPLDALRAVTPEVAVVAKRETALPSLAGEANVWVEPDEPRHPLTGIVHALTRGGQAGARVAADLPLVPAALLRDARSRRPSTRWRSRASACSRCCARLVLRRSAPLARRSRRASPPRRRCWPCGRRGSRPQPAWLLRHVNKPEDLAAAEIALRARSTLG